MTPEERSAEMKRRRAVQRKNEKKASKKGPAKGKKGYKCKHCNKPFKDKYRLANHIRYEHPKRAKKANEAGPEASLRNLERMGQDGVSRQESQEDHSHHVSYIFGKVETIIEYYARSNGVPYAALAEGVAGLLRH